MYLESETVNRFKRTHSCFTPAKITMFYRNICPCILQPSMQSCVDIIRSANLHYMRAISKFVRNNKTILDHLTKATWIGDLNDNPKKFIDNLCCVKLLHPELVCRIGKSIYIPAFVPWVCASGECIECVTSKTINEEKCQILMVSNVYVHVLEWKDVSGQGKTKNGKQRTQLELARTYVQIKDIMRKFIDHLPVTRLHQAEYKRTNFMRQLYIIMLHALHDKVFLTNFRVTMSLEASEKDNNSVANHAVRCIFLVVMNWRGIKYFIVMVQKMKQLLMIVRSGYFLEIRSVKVKK